MAAQIFVFPGEELLSESLPVSSNPSVSLKLGPGLRHLPPSTITPTVAGPLYSDRKKNAVWVENHNGRYIPQTSDVVIATVHHSSTDYFHCSLTEHTTLAQLPQLAFEGVNKKTRPQLTVGSLVYARVISASKHLDPEIVCYNPSSGKSEGMGELKGGMVFDVSLGMAKRLLMAKQKEDGGILVLEEIAGKVPFEIAIGKNGKVWVNSRGVKEILLVGKALQETERKDLDSELQKKLVRKLLKSLESTV
ncbi:exosome non-catalytic core subunit rrp40 [Varicellaria rhodocarpa]|nr:exosome non-catalytic core subunit rrp40 [Varicellaria rhodocarpa]